MTLEAARAFFKETFGVVPEYVASAPARVNLIGEHSDYNGGEVLPMAIGLRTFVAIGGISTVPMTSVVSNSKKEQGTFEIGNEQRSGKWWDYIAGVSSRLSYRSVILPQAQIAVASDIPPGAGLSSSAALEVAAALAFIQLGRRDLSMYEIARLAWEAETQFVGVPSGIMDQFASALGEASHALHIWCDTEETEQVPCLEQVLIFDTGIPRELRQSEFGTRKTECEQAFTQLKRNYPGLTNLAAATPEQVMAANLPDPMSKRALHVVEEQHRVREAVRALKQSGIIPGELLIESHESLRTLFECSIPELDWFVQHIMDFDGVRGARMTGAGWGGCAIATGDPEVLTRVQHQIVKEYRNTFDRQARTWIVDATLGAKKEN